MCLTAAAWIVPLPAEASVFTIHAVQSDKHRTPNLFDPRSNSKSGPARKLLSPTLGTQPADNSSPGTRGGTPNAKPGNDAGLMVPESFQLSAGAPGHFLSRDGKLEIDVPAEALSASDVAADGGSTSLAVSQISPGSGSNAGGSGHFSYGTFLLQALDAKGKVAKHGLRAPVSLKLHLGSQGTGLDVTNSYLALNSYYRGDLGAPSSLAGQEALTVAATAPMGPMTNVSTVFDPASQTIGAMASLLSPSTAASFGTSSTSVATFGKPQPFEASLSGGALTAGYPLDLPVGPKGVKPPLVLAYNSAAVNGQHNAQGAAGWVGEGWNMSMGAISWAEHYVADAGGTAWQDSWQLSDPYGTAVDLIPPTTSTAIYQEDSGRAIATSPVQWQANPMIYAKIYSFQSALTIAGNPTPPCWRVFLTNGVMEEFGCTADSLEYYPNSAGKAYVYSWLLDMIVEPEGNQIHVAYNRDMQTLFGLSYPRDAVMNTVEWGSPTCSNTSTMCTTTGTAPNLWAPLMRVSFAASHAVVRSPSGSTNCGAAIGNLRCDDAVDLTASGGVGIPSVQSDYVLNDIYVQVCNAGCSSSTPTWNTLKDYQLGYDQSGPGSIPIDPISGKPESTAGKLNLTQVTVYGDDGSTALPVTNYTYTKVVEYYEDSLFFPAGAGGIGLCSFSACQNGNGSTNCGPSPGVGAINTGYTPYQRGCVLWNQSYDGNSYYVSAASNGIGLAQSFTWVNLRSNLHGTDWWNGHNGGYWNLGYNPTWCNTNQSNIYPCNMADDGVWSRVGLASRTDNLVRLTQNGQGGVQTSTPVSGTTYYTYQVVFPDAVQVCPLQASGYPSACVAGFSWGSAYDNDYLDFYNGIFMGFTQVQVTNPDGSVEAHKFFSAEGWGGWGPNNAQGGTVGLSIICPYSAQSTPPNIDTCWSDPYWDVANQASYPGQANALHGREYEVDRYDTNGATLLDQVKTQYNPVCTPPIIPAGSPSVSGYTNNGWDGNLVSALDLGNPEVPCDVQIIQVDHYRYDGATGTVPDQTTTYAYETGVRPCATCYGRQIKTTTSSNDGNVNGNPVNIVKTAGYSWNDSVAANSNSVSGRYLINFPGFTDIEDATGNKKQCAYTSYDRQPNVLGATAGLTKGDATRSSTYTDCASIVIANELATTSFYDSLGNLVAQRDPNTSQYGNSPPPRSGCVAPSQGDLTFFTSCTAFDNYFNALTVKRDNVGATTTIAYQAPAGATGAGGFGLWPMSTTDWNNQTTSYAYDALGRPTSVTQPLETAGLTTQSVAYAVWCSGSAAQGPCAEIDQTQRLNSTQTVTARTFYDGAGNVVETRNPGPTGQDVVQYSFYDSSQRQVFKSVAYLVAAYTVAGYTGPPGAGAYSIPDSTVAGTTYSYDGLGRTKSIRNPVSSTTNVAYGVACNAMGTGDSACYNQALTDDPLNHRSGVLKDAMGRTLYEQKYTGNSAATWAVYATTKYQYDYVGDLIWILHPDGVNNTTTQYDMAGRRTQNFDGDVRQQNFTYDKNGNLTQMVDGRQSAAGTTFIGYDLLNRPIWRNTTNSSSGAYDNYSYDSTASGNFGVGRLTGETFTAVPANSLSGSESFVYDARGRQISSTLTVGANSYLLRTAYDDAGNVLNQTYPTGEVVTNSLTAQAWLSGVSTTMGSMSLLSGAAYAGTGGASGLITSGSLAGGLYQYSASFDLLARAYDINLKKGTATLFDQTRTFDASGNVGTANTTLPSGTDNQAFCYDEQNRVVAAASSGTVPCQTFSAGNLSGANYNQSFTYDYLGRLTNGPLGAYSYAGAFQPHGAYKIGTTYTAAYDGAGNMICRAVTSATTCQGTQTGAQLAYNNQGQFSNWQDKPGTPNTTGAFLYDGQGTRVAQQIVQGGVTTTSVYIGNIEQVTYIVGGTGTSTPVNGPAVNSLGTRAPTMQTASSQSNAAALASSPAALTTGPDAAPSFFCDHCTFRPGAPTNVIATPGNAQATVTWTAPGDGGSPITGYTITPFVGSTAGTPVSAGAAATSATVTGLANGTTYTFQVTATNSRGTGPPGTSNAVTPTGTSTVPTAPQTVSVTAGNAQATVSWAAPVSDGGSPITGYTVTSSPGALTASAGATATSAVVTGLTNGTSYTFTVTATNAIGIGPASAPSNAVTPATVPGAPTGVTATAGNAQATVSWTAPASNGGAAITGYTVTPYVGTTAGTPVSAAATATSTTVTGLVNGTTYTFQVTATNAMGTGPAGTSNAVTPVAAATVPGAPTAVTATAGNAQATVTWTAPADGGSPITGYTVTSSPGGLTASARGTATSAIVTGLTNGTSYTFAVTATNAIGTGPVSSPSNPVIPATVPGPPTGVTATAGNTQATVSWTAPASNGGSAITSYTVSSSPGGITATASGTATSAVVTGLTNGTNYTFAVIATNAVGTGAASVASNAVTPATVPDAPAGVTATAGNAQATVTWTAPANGGSAITGYTVTSSPGSFTATASSSATSATVINLVNGTTYTFTVTATNAIGTGPASAASNAVTPAAIPSAPTGVTATAGNAQATVTWTAPANGGSPITSYTVTSSPGGFSATTPNGTTTMATVTGLTNGTAYTFTVTATNAAGTGPASTPSNSLTPAAPPGAPTGVTAAAGTAQVAVSWTAPASNGGSPITSYTVTSSPGGLSATTPNGTTTTATVTGLTNGTAYTFTVTATNLAGTSPASAPSNSVTPAAPPGTPTGVTATAGNAQAAVSWTAPASNGGSAITSYTVTSSPGALTATSSITTATVTGLANGTSYTFTVTATNWAGTGPASAPSNAVVPAGPPAVPTNVGATAGNAQASVTWTAPASNNGALITSYTVTSTPGGLAASVNGSTTTATVTGLTNGTSYTFSVTATSSAGTSAASSPSNSVTPAAPPGAATNVAATGGMGQATVTWTAPASNGGAAITSYTVTSSPGGISVTTPDGATTTGTVTGLTNGTAYTFTVTAANWAGTGPASAVSSPVTPGITIRTYYYANGMRIATAVNGIVSYLLSDGLGSANVVLNGSGSVTASELFAPYGSVRYSSGTMPTDYAFTGQHSDSITGLDYYVARYYDPVAGQFTSADTIVPGGGYDIWGLSRYAYVEGNPIVRTDPTGQRACENDYNCNGPEPQTTSSSSGGADEATTYVVGPSGAVTPNSTTSVSDIPQIRINAKTGLAYESDVQSYLETQFNSDDYVIVRNKAIRDPMTGKALRIDDRYVRPDFQVIDRATGRLAAIYEAKTGSIEYLSGPGSAKYFVYESYARAYEASARMTSGTVPVEAVYQVAENAVKRPLGATVGRTLGRAQVGLIILTIGITAYELYTQQKALEDLKSKDPVYYNQLVYQAACSSGSVVCA